ncbi:hypothetical protein HDU83_002850 [Entophlyctis luteolus]|nr:hypothetical protein HDU83_002850 [Entophlyctis luteolus]
MSNAPTNKKPTTGGSLPTATPRPLVSAPAATSASVPVKLKREIDKPDIPPPVEEHLILRVENPLLARTLKELVHSKDPAALEKLAIRFADARKGTLSFDGTKYPATLVDLPCIIESQKTWDNRQLYKICDISQMLIVSEEGFAGLPKDSSEDFVYPHGISAPLHFVRKRRFRKRISKRAIENVEREVERLLRADADAEMINYEHVETEFDLDGEDDVADNTNSAGPDAGGGMSMPAEDDGAVVDFDDDELAAELEQEVEDAMLADDDEGDEEGDDDDDDDDDDDEDEGGATHNHATDAAVDDASDDDGALKYGRFFYGSLTVIILPDDAEDEETRALREEIEELENTISEKQQQLEEQTNPIMRTRFEGMVKKLKDELAKKKGVLQNLTE